jgi:uncharacterized membrane protein
VTVGVTDPPEPSGAPRGRVTSIDALRGIVMILMALDHVRDFVHHEAMVASPTDLARTTPLLFLTRWVTHFCATVFIMTAGLGAWFWWRRGRSRSQLAGFLLTRGMWLVLLELTVMRLAYNFSVSLEYPVFLLVLWVLGACMIGLALLVWVPPRVMMIAALATIALHNLLDPNAARDLGGAAAVWNLLHQAGAFRLGQLTVIVGYPLLPWIAVMALGFASGPLFRLAPAERQRILVTAGAAATIGFTALRAWNGYGDPAPWQPQPSPVFTALSFLNTTKYPPSLLFLLMTLGPALLLLALFERRAPPWLAPLATYGKVPLFYFVLHLFAIHVLAVIVCAARYGAIHWMFESPDLANFPITEPPGWPLSLPLVYVIWIGIVAALYPLCRWYAAIRTRHAHPILSYL